MSGASKRAASSSQTHSREASLQQLRVSAENGDASALISLGRAHVLGELGAEESAEKAKEYLQAPALADGRADAASRSRVRPIDVFQRFGVTVCSKAVTADTPGCYHSSY